MGSTDSDLSQPATISVLVVEDNVFLRNSVVRALNRETHALGTSSAEEALTLLGSRRFDAILTDFDLGEGEDGGRLLERIRATLPDVRRVLMSGRHDLSERVDPPWQCFLPKPVTNEEVRAAVRADAGDRDRMGNVSAAAK